MGSSDPQDYYRISLATRGNFNLRLAGLSADADVQLLDAAGRVLASSTRWGTNSEDIVRLLEAGTYYVRVYQYSGDTPYNLTLSATPA